MCGRFAQGFAADEVAHHLAEDSLHVDETRDLDSHHATFNAAPTTVQMVYRRDRGSEDESTDAEGSSRATKHVLQGMRWGLIPFWTKRAPDSSGQLKTINCRDDSLKENKGLWNSLKGRKRCIVPVQGYYEWLKKGNTKIPHFTKHKDGRMMLLAGLYDAVQYEGSDEVIRTFTIVTTAANAELAWLHDRMPLILDRHTAHQWLDDDAWTQQLVDMLKPYEGALDCYQVRQEVGKVGNNSSDFIIPIDSKENKANIANFFNKSPTKDDRKPAVKTEAKDNGLSENNAPVAELQHPVHSKTKTADVVAEEVLPFKCVLSHLESRPLETVDVWTATISAKDSGRLFRFVAAELQSDEKESLSHLKRIRPADNLNKRIKLEEGSKRKPDQVQAILCSALSKTQEELETMLLAANFPAEVQVCAVPKYAALTLQQLEAWQVHWPLNWRPSTQRKVNITQTELETWTPVMENVLTFAKDSAEAKACEMPVAAIAWDPVRRVEVARVADTRSATGHPLRHAIIDLVASVAAHEVARRLEAGPDTPTGYLCSGLYIFVTHEPCTMCCMALLHSRVAKVFYAQAVPNTGAFESSYGIHWRKELNHRFQVFGGWLEEHAQYVDEDADVAELQVDVDAEVDLESELFGNHPPRSFAETEQQEDFEERKQEQGVKPVQHATSQPRRARAALKKRTPKMTDFFH